MLLCFYIGGKPKSKWFFFIFHWLIWVPVRSTTPFSPAFLHPAFLSLLQRYYTPSYQTLLRILHKTKLLLQRPWGWKKNPNHLLSWGSYLLPLACVQTFEDQMLLRKLKLLEALTVVYKTEEKHFILAKMLALYSYCCYFSKGQCCLLIRNQKIIIQLRDTCLVKKIVTDLWVPEGTGIAKVTKWCSFTSS